LSSGETQWALATQQRARHNDMESLLQMSLHRRQI
jgi:hypothetical protein